MSPAITLEITHLGHRGDGIGEGPSGRLHVAGALPGERVRVVATGERGRLVSIEQASPERVTPICPLAGRCGGCALQHRAPAATLAWKRELVVEALAQRGLAAEVEPCRDAHGEGRRRVVLHARRHAGAMRVGFMAARSHDLVAIEACPVLAPALARAPLVATMLADALSSFGEALDIQVTATETGLDVDLRGSGPLPAGDRERLIAVARRLDLARLGRHGEPIVSFHDPTSTLGRARFVPPPGGFLQATAAAEALLAGLVGEAVGPAASIADLFAGCGPFALRLAERARVHAVELDRPALAALEKAARGAKGLKPITTEARDLFRRPLGTAELKRFEAVVLDPPRAGAEAQCRELARSELRRAVMVSCAPASFSRDARLLVDGGWRLEKVVPLDQFRYSAHVELVATFSR